MILATDATDDKALERRLEVRDEHLAVIKKYRESGNMLMGAARLNDKGTMTGSVLICDFKDRDALNAYLREEPFITHNVWGEVKVETVSVGPSFLGKAKK